jgi:hypothetical protein
VLDQYNSLSHSHSLITSHHHSTLIQARRSTFISFPRATGDCHVPNIDFFAAAALGYLTCQRCARSARNGQSCEASLLHTGMLHAMQYKEAVHSHRALANPRLLASSQLQAHARTACLRYTGGAVMRGAVGVVSSIKYLSVWHRAKSWERRHSACYLRSRRPGMKGHQWSVQGVP